MIKSVHDQIDSWPDRSMTRLVHDQIGPWPDRYMTRLVRIFPLRSMTTSVPTFWTEVVMNRSGHTPSWAFQSSVTTVPELICTSASILEHFGHGHFSPHALQSSVTSVPGLVCTSISVIEALLVLLIGIDFLEKLGVLLSIRANVCTKLISDHPHVQTS